MKKSKFLLTFMIALILLTACANSSSQESNNSELPNNSDVEKTTEPTDSNNSETEKAIVSVDYSSDDILSKYTSFTGFIDFEDENSQEIIFTTNVPVKDFKFIEVGYEEKDTDVVFFKDKVLYSQEELTPEKPFTVSWMEQGSIPNRGISYIDETDTTRYFYIIMSGEDGSLLLVEFENE
ncbi:MAG: hypothetical protein GX675_02790 [Erysipelotrichaceae bacterium]|nr:hypothetical protein [Erysipelotrichaceae bacterium]